MNTLSNEESLVILQEVDGLEFEALDWVDTIPYGGNGFFNTID